MAISRRQLSLKTIANLNKFKFLTTQEKFKQILILQSGILTLPLC